MKGQTDSAARSGNGTVNEVGNNINRSQEKSKAQISKAVLQSMENNKGGDEQGLYYLQ
jgi:hypothetical protein